MTEFAWNIALDGPKDGVMRHHVIFQSLRWRVWFQEEITEDHVQTEARSEAERRIRVRAELGDTADRHIVIKRTDIPAPRRG